MADALFERIGGHYRPTDFSRGPWSPDALHGGPVAALVAREAEACETPVPMHPTRLTLELLRPVPVAPLALTATVVRPGRKVQLVDVRVATAADDQEVAWARMLRVRTLGPDDPLAEGVPGPLEVRPTDDPPPPGPHEGGELPGPEQVGQQPMAATYRAFHSAGAELRFVRGEFQRLGPSTVWVRLAVPVVEGEEPSPMQRAAAAADFGNGVSAELAFGQFLFINPDLSVHLDRPPSGEWVCLDARTAFGAPGIGLSQCTLWDLRGPIGRSLQSLLVERLA